MTMMEEIMEKLGVELDEEFSVKYTKCSTFYSNVKFVKTNDEYISLVTSEYEDMPEFKEVEK